MTKVIVNDEYLNNVAHKSFMTYVSNAGNLDGIYGDVYQVVMKVQDMLTGKIDTTRITVPSRFAELVDAKEIKVDYNFGQARDEARFGENSGVIYMMAKIGDEELYTEIPTDAEDYDDIDENDEEEMMAKIRRQAREAGLDEILLNFGK